MKEHGLVGAKKILVLKYGQTARFTRVITTEERNRVLVFTNGQMELYMKENGVIIRLQAM
jgi:hypothetical protein